MESMLLYLTLRRLRVDGFGKISFLLLPLLVALIALTGRPDMAQAIPSFARQTGQPCAACHTSFPELTPFGRRFKLSGYTLGGKTLFSGMPPIAGMIVQGFTHTAKDQTAHPAPMYGKNDNYAIDEMSIFYGGAIAGDLGAFIQGTVDGIAQEAALDNTDIRYAHTLTLGGTSTVVGIDVNNNPTVQDVWNTTPAWGWPQFASGLAPEFEAPGAIVQEAFGGQVASVSGYTFWNDMVYAEAGGIIPLGKSLQRSMLGAPGDNKLNSVAPYARLAVETTWDKVNLMVGGFFMAVNQQPGWVGGFGTDNYQDFGADTQLQYMGDTNIFTLKASYIYEKQRLNSSFAQGASSSVNNNLDIFNVSGTWVYDKVYSLQAGFTSVWGSKDALVYGDSATGSPNSQYVTVDASWSPFMEGGPDVYKTFNVRMGVQYTHYFKLLGGTSNFNGGGVNASDNDTVWLYTVAAF